MSKPANNYTTTTYKFNKYHHDRGIRIATYSKDSYQLLNKQGGRILIPKSLVAYDQQDDGNILVSIPDWLLDSHNGFLETTNREFVMKYWINL